MVNSGSRTAVKKGEGIAHNFIYFLFAFFQVGDQVVEVNGMDFSNMDHKEVKKRTCS